jgi:hypothetical protein
MTTQIKRTNEKSRVVETKIVRNSDGSGSRTVTEKKKDGLFGTTDFGTKRVISHTTYTRPK